MKKILASVFLSLLFAANTAFAQSVVVTGNGTSRDGAINDAKRNAVEQVVGTYIDSKTLVSNYTVVSDEVYSQAYGFVKDIDIIKEGDVNGSYFVQARVEVDTNPNSPLQNKLKMIMLLGDPRIGVIVFKDVTNTTGDEADVNFTNNIGNISYDNITEQAINQRLLSLGFNNIADVSITSKLRKSALLNSVYTGENGIIEDDGHQGVDILVLAKSNLSATKIEMPRKDGTSFDTKMYRGNANVTGKVIILSTGYIKGTFSVNSAGIDISPTDAQQKALQEISGKIVDEVEKILHQQAARVFKGLQIVAKFENPDDLQRFLKDLEGIRSIQSVRMREFKNNEAIIEAETSMKSYDVLNQLRNSTKFGIFNDDIKDNYLKISVISN